MSQTQVGGDHYTKLGITPFEYSMANRLDAMQHTAIKYITRFRDKNGIVDLEKARDTIDQLIKHESLKASQDEPKQDPNEAFPKNLEYDDAISCLLDQLTSSGMVKELDRIVVIPRGGLTIGHVIAEALNFKEVELYNPSIIYEGNVLLVDDINDSGSTFIEILSGNPERFRNGVLTAVLAQRYSSKVSSDFIGTIIDHDRYVIFPWENIDGN